MFSSVAVIFTYIVSLILVRLLKDIFSTIATDEVGSGTNNFVPFIKSTPLLLIYAIASVIFEVLLNMKSKIALVVVSDLGFAPTYISRLLPIVILSLALEALSNILTSIPSISFGILISTYPSSDTVAFLPLAFIYEDSYYVTPV